MTSNSGFQTQATDQFVAPNQPANTVDRKTLMAFSQLQYAEALRTFLNEERQEMRNRRERAELARAAETAAASSKRLGGN